MIELLFFAAGIIGGLLGSYTCQKIRCWAHYRKMVKRFNDVLGPCTSTTSAPRVPLSKEFMEELARDGE